MTQAYEAELRKFMVVEQAVVAIPELHKLRSLWIETTGLKTSLGAQAAAWKTQFAKILHKKGNYDLQVIQC